MRPPADGEDDHVRPLAGVRRWPVDVRGAGEGRLRPAAVRLCVGERRLHGGDGAVLPRKDRRGQAQGVPHGAVARHTQVQPRAAPLRGRDGRQGVRGRSAAAGDGVGRERRLEAAHRRKQGQEDAAGGEIPRRLRRGDDGRAAGSQGRMDWPCRPHRDDREARRREFPDGDEVRQRLHVRRGVPRGVRLRRASPRRQAVLADQGRWA